MNYKNYLEILLEITLRKSASDLHVCVGKVPVLRISRKLYDLEGEKPIKPEDAEGIVSALITEEQKEGFLKDREIDFGYNYKDQARFRVNVYFERGNMAIAFRMVPKKIRTIDELGLPDILHKLTDASYGFVLVTGASSQGKSTTLAALIDEINHKRREHIITIEEPIEYVFENDESIINQREVPYDSLSFPAALRSTLREDPDVIMVGEMRDLETISTAITASETGHLVFATLHTNSASQTIHRMIDVFPPHQQNQIRAQLSNSLLAVVSQKLLLTTKGGTTPACEVLFNNSAISNLIRENKIHEIPSVIETSGDSGMVPLNSSLVSLVKDKQITKETAIRHSINPQDLKSRLGRFS